MRQTLPFILMLALALSACDSDFHAGEQGLAVALHREDVTETVSANSLNLWVCDASQNTVATRTYATPAALAADVVSLSAADYTVVAAMNLDSRYAVTQSPMTITTTESNPPHAYYGTQTVTLAERGLTVADISLRRVLAQHTITVTGLPETCTIAATVTNAATGIHPHIWDDANARYGVATSTPATVDMPSATAAGSVTTTCRLMPTVANEPNSILRLAVTGADGSGKLTNIVAPKMYSGANYIFEVAYDELSSGLILSSVRINGWTDGWVINGEITDSDNQ